MKRSRKASDNVVKYAPIDVHKKSEEAIKFDEKSGPGPRVNGSFFSSPLAPHILFLFGGERLDRHGESLYLGDFWNYNVITNKWVEIKNTVGPGARSSHQTCVLNGGRTAILYGGETCTIKEATGGKKRPSSAFVHYSDTWILEILDDTGSSVWNHIQCRKSPSSRSGHRMVALSDRFALLYGGFKDTGKGDCHYFDDVWIFDVKFHEWTMLESVSPTDPKPCARSGAILFTPQHTIGSNSIVNTEKSSTLSAENSGESSHPSLTQHLVYLYGGYTTEGHGDSMRGVVLRQLWSLDLIINNDSTASKIEKFHWKQLKNPPTAPPKRSGISAQYISGEGCLISLGGIADTEDKDLLLGTCSNEVYTYTPISESKGTWELCECTINPPRYNAMLASVPGSSKVYVYGGLCEVGDQLITLDDLQLISKETVSNAWTVGSVSPLCSEISAAMIRAQSLVDSSDDDSDRSNDSENSNSSEYGLTSEDEDSDDSDHQSGQPKPSGYSSLKDFFGENTDYWLGLARVQAEALGKDCEMDAKSLRAAAFALAKRSWELVPPTMDDVRL